MNDIVIRDMQEPIRKQQGELAIAPELGGVAIKKAIKDSGVNFDDIEEVIMGCVLQAGIGQAPARQAGFNAGLSKIVPAVTVNKMVQD